MVVKNTSDSHLKRVRLATEEQHAEIFEEYGTRYTELTRLRYFDTVRMPVIDPMHCSLQVGTSLSIDTQLKRFSYMRHDNM